MKYFEQLDIHSLTFNGFSQPHLDLTITLLSFIQVVWFMIYHLQYLCNGRSDSPSGGVTSLATVLRKGRRTVLRIRAENSSPHKGGEQFSAVLQRTFSALLRRIPEDTCSPLPRCRQPGRYEDEELFVFNMTAKMSNTVTSLFKWGTMPWLGLNRLSLSGLLK